MNKKLLKSIVCIGFGVGVASSIPFAATSCGSSQEKINPLPDTVYKYDETNPKELVGFTDEFSGNPDAYSDCNAIEIPVEVTSIGDAAFKQKIPPFIHKIIFPENSKCTIINNSAFRTCASLTSVTLSGSLTSIGQNVFNECSNLSSITWDAWNGNTTFGTNLFVSISAKGKVTVINPIDATHNSKQLLSVLKQNGLPEGWTI